MKILSRQVGGVYERSVADVRAVTRSRLSSEFAVEAG